MTGARVKGAVCGLACSLGCVLAVLVSPTLGQGLAESGLLGAQ